jgi:hypothetical protein
MIFLQDVAHQITFWRNFKIVLRRVAEGLSLESAWWAIRWVFTENISGRAKPEYIYTLDYVTQVGRHDGLKQSSRCVLIKASVSKRLVSWQTAVEHRRCILRGNVPFLYGNMRSSGILRCLKSHKSAGLISRWKPEITQFTYVFWKNQEQLNFN